MTTVERARELVAEQEAKMFAWKQDEAKKLVERADVNIIDSATRGRRYTDVGLNGYTDKQIIQLATDEIIAAGYKVSNKGSFLTIEW
jgi:hypothetical protein